MDFSNRITDIAAGKAFIDGLQAAGLMFHFEDSAETIINCQTGRAIFTKAEAQQIRQRVAELYALDWETVGHECPIGYALEAGDPVLYKPTVENLSEEFAAYLKVYGLPQMSAEELIHETLTAEQRRWVSGFIRRWEAVA